MPSILPLKIRLERLREKSKTPPLSHSSSLPISSYFSPFYNKINIIITTLMFDINEDYVICDGMKMSRKDAIEYMQGR